MAAQSLYNGDLSLLDFFYSVPPVKTAVLEALQQPSKSITSTGLGCADIRAARQACKELRKLVDDNVRELTVRVPCPVAWGQQRQGRWPLCSSLTIAIHDDVDEELVGGAPRAVVNSLSAAALFCPAGLQRITHLRFAPVAAYIMPEVIPLVAALPNLRVLDLTGLGASLRVDNWRDLCDRLPDVARHLEELVMPCCSGETFSRYIDYLPRALGEVRSLRRLRLLAPQLEARATGISIDLHERDWPDLASHLPFHLQELQLYSSPDNDSRGPSLTLTQQGRRLVSVSATGFPIASLDMHTQAAFARQLERLPQFPSAGQKLPQLRLGELVIPDTCDASDEAQVLQLLRRVSRLEVGHLVVDDVESAVPGLLQCRPDKISVAFFFRQYLTVALRQLPQQGAGGSPGLPWPMPTAADRAQRAATRMGLPVAFAAPLAGDRSSAGVSKRQGPNGATEAASSETGISGGASTSGSASAGGAARQQGPQLYVPRLLLLRGRRIAELLRDTEALEGWLRSLQDVPQDDPQPDGEGADTAGGGSNVGGTSTSAPRRVRLLEGYQLFPCDVADALLLECSFREGALEEVERAVGRRAREERDAATAVCDLSSWLEALRVPFLEAPAGAPLSGLEGGRRVYLRLVEQELEELYSVPLGRSSGAGGGIGSEDGAAGSPPEGQLVECVMDLAWQVMDFPTAVFTIGHVEQRSQAADVPFWFR